MGQLEGNGLQPYIKLRKMNRALEDAEKVAVLKGRGFSR
jgi:hypothetical protein